MEKCGIGDTITLGRVLLKRRKRRKYTLLEMGNDVVQHINVVVATSIAEKEKEIEEKGSYGGRSLES